MDITPSDTTPSRHAGHAPLAGIVILNWNGWRDTMDAVTAVRAQTYTNHRIYVVDNGSTDGSEAKLRAWDSALRLIQTGANLGWSGGNNAGIRAARQDGCAHVLLLNNDAVPDPDCLATLVQAATSLPDAAALGALIVGAADRDHVEFGGSYVPDRTHLPRQHHGPRRTLIIPPDPTPTVAVKGCAMLLTAAGLERVGPLADEYFLNYDETDWCYRALACGMRNYLVSQAIAAHKGAVAFGGTERPLYQYFTTRNRLVFARRHLDRRGRWFAWRGVLWELRQALRGPGAPGGARPRRAAAILMAVWDYMWGRMGDCPPVIRTWNRVPPGEASSEAV